MSNDEFKLLNNYLNRVFILLSRNDQFLINNIDLLDFFCQELSNALSDIDINFKSNENKITYLDVINISAEVIASIDSKYLKTFYKLISDGTIDFSYNNEYNYSHISLLNNQNTKLININRNFNYSDVVALVHEFFHYTNLKSNSSLNQYILTEFISIYFETYTINYLKQKNIPYSEIVPNDRIGDLIDCINSYQSYSPILLGYEKFGNINLDTLKKLNKYFFEYTKEEFDEDCYDLLGHFYTQEEHYYNQLSVGFEKDQDEFDYCISQVMIDNYRYLLGTVLSFYCLTECDIKTIVDLNDNINDKYEDMDILDIFKMLNVKNNKDMIKKSISNMLKFIKENNKKIR